MDNLPKNDFIPIVYNLDTNFTNITNVLLIDNDVQDYIKFVENCNDTTFPIIFDRGSNSDDVKNLLADKFTDISRIAIVSNNSLLEDKKILLSNHPYFYSNDLLEGVTSYSSNVRFIIDLIKSHNVKNIDYLACYSLNDENWRRYYEVLIRETGVIIGASDDKTGNIKYGGDWIMESSGEDIEQIYFTSGISNYQGSLVISTISTSGTITQSGVNFIFTPNTGTADTLSWPVTLSGTITVTIGGDLTFTSISNYFTITSVSTNNVTIEGNYRKITINVSNYPGLVNSKSGNTVINKIGIVAGTGTLKTYSGWFGHDGPTITDNGKTTTNGGFVGNINYCYSIGDITTGSGGIVGRHAGVSSVTLVSCNINNCYSTGNIAATGGGGISGEGTARSYAATGGTVPRMFGYSNIKQCYSTGTISGESSGGISGIYAGSGLSDILSPNFSFIIENCFSTGDINGTYAGGIVGSYSGSNEGNVSIAGCYSTGDINGSEAGGIVGSSSALLGRSYISNCYNTGSVNNSGSASIVGYNSVNSCVVKFCYITGTNNRFQDPNTHADVDDSNKSSNGWDDTVANQCIGLIGGIWKLIYTNYPWKLKWRVENFTYQLSNGVLTYSSLFFPICTITNPIFINLFNNGWYSNNQAITVTDKSVSFNIPSGSYDVNTYLILYNDNLEPYYENYFSILTTISQSGSLTSINNFTPTSGSPTPLYWPITLSGNITLTINTNLIFPDKNYYFIITSDSNNIVTIDGTNYTITINVSDYNGVVTSYSSATIVKNIGVISTSGSLPYEGGGWIGNGGKNIYIVETDTWDLITGFLGTIDNCYSNANINGNGNGGIVGAFAGCSKTSSNDFCIVKNCYSTGNIGDDSMYCGGIAGSNAGYAQHNDQIQIFGFCTILNCYSRGDILGLYGGGIVAGLAGSAGNSIESSNGHCVINNCYSTGNIIGNNTGGIVGAISGVCFGSNGIGNCEITNCYSIGNIIGEGAGGIAASNLCNNWSTSGSGSANVTITNCYTIGNVTGNSSGGIVGRAACNTYGSTDLYLNISNCYTMGTTTGSSTGSIVGNEATSYCIIKNCYITGSDRFQPSSSSATIDNTNKISTGWNDTIANECLINIGTVWKIIHTGSPWKLYSYLNSVQIQYTYDSNGTLVYTNVFRINIYSNVTSVGLSNNNTMLPITNQSINLTDKTITFTGVSTYIDNSLNTLLVLFNNTGNIIDYADAFKITSAPPITISQSGILSSKHTFIPNIGDRYIVGYPMTLSGTVTITINSDLEFNSINDYFIITNDVNNNVIIDGGKFKKITINFPNYLGLVDSKSNNTIIRNIEIVTTSPGTLATYSGWVGRGTNDGTIYNGFLGTIKNCYNTNTTRDGGIAGYYGGYKGSRNGFCTIKNNYTTSPNSFQLKWYWNKKYNL